MSPLKVAPFLMIAAFSSCSAPRPPERTWQDVYGGTIPLKLSNDSDYFITNIRVWNKEVAPVGNNVIALRLGPHESKTVRIRPGHFDVTADGAFRREGVTTCPAPDDCRDVRPDSFDVATVHAAAGFRLVFFRVAADRLPANLYEADGLRLAVIPKGGGARPVSEVVPLPEDLDAGGGDGGDVDAAGPDAGGADAGRGDAGGRDAGLDAGRGRVVKSAR